MSERESKFEFLRILAMFLIVLCHLSIHGIINYITPAHNSTIESFNYFCSLIFSGGGKIGVDIFILITGYFMINKSFKIESFIKTIFVVFVYSYLFLFAGLIFVEGGGNSISSAKLLSSVFPIGGNQYWFMTTYICLYALIPFLNILFNIISKNQYIKLICLLFIFWCILPTLVKGANYSFSNLGWFIFLYGVGGYIKIYNLSIKNKYLYVAMFICASLLSISLASVIFRPTIDLFSAKPTNNNLWIFIMSCIIFLLTKNYKIKNNKIVNTIAQATFGIYLIHENQLFRPFLWHNLLHIENLVDMPLFFPMAICIASIVFFLCFFVDKILSCFYMPVINYLINFFKNKIMTFITKKPIY